MGVGAPSGALFLGSTLTAFYVLPARVHAAYLAQYRHAGVRRDRDRLRLWPAAGARATDGVCQSRECDGVLSGAGVLRADGQPRESAARMAAGRGGRAGDDRKSVV